MFSELNPEMTILSDCVNVDTLLVPLRRLFLLDALVAQSTDEKVLERVVLFVNRLLLHPNIKPDTTRHLIKVHSKSNLISGTMI